MWFEDNIKKERKTQSKKQLANFLTKKPELIPVLTKKKKKKRLQNAFNMSYK